MAQTAFKKRFGDRKEGRLIRTIAPLYKFMPYIMRERSDSCNQYADSIDIAPAEIFFREQRAAGYKGMGMLHLFLAAYIRAVAYRPGLNRFISGQKIYARNKIIIVMAVKRSLTSDSSETTIKLEFSPHDTIFDVYRILNAKVDEIKADDGDNGTEKAAAAFGKLPGLIFKFAIWLINFMDYFDLLPQSLLDVSPFHGSMIITDMGSLGISPIYHHIYNFGNLPVFLSFGCKRKEIELNAEGQVEEHKYVDFKLVLDERTVDGFYYASALKYIKYFLMNPKVLESPPEKVEDDIF